MTPEKSNAMLALARLESVASAVSHAAMQARVALAVGLDADFYSPGRRLVSDAERVHSLAVEADKALDALDEVPE